MRRPASGWSATNRRKYAVCAGSECVLREPLAELVGLSFSLRDHQTSIDRCDEPLETHTRGRRRLASRHRSRAAGSEGAQERARPSSPHGPRVVELDEPRANGVVVDTALDRERSWPGAGSIVRARATPSPRAPGRADECPRPRARPIELARRRPSRSACRRSRGSSGSRDHHEVPSPGRRAAGCSSRRRRLPGSRERAAVARDEAIPHVLAPCHRADDDAGRVLGRQVLERVNGEVDLAVAERRSSSA